MPDGERWLDLATGLDVAVRVRDVGDDWPAIAMNLHAQLLRPAPDGTTLLDYGRVGTSRWFEARSRAGGEAPAAFAELAREVAAVVDTYCLAGEVRVVRAASRADREGWWHLFTLLARALRDVGLVVIRPAVVPGPDALPQLLTRHVGLICADDDRPARALEWVRRLTRWSRRRHLLCTVGAAVRPGRHAFVRESVASWKEGMGVLQFVPRLLQVVHDAEDEGIALASACSWLRMHAGASAVAIVSDPDGGLVAQDGWRGEAPRPAELTAVCRERPAATLLSSAAAAPSVTAPVRYGGSVIGHVVARGPGSEAGELEEGVQALAALAGPALRARLDARMPPDDVTALMPEVIGRSPAMTLVREAVGQAARTFFPVLIDGESGTGKELVARALHRLSARRHRRFMAVNCAALTDDLVEAELFGFARGAFTGAMAARSGLFEEASGGSLFLDEVSELSARAQAKLLRALQEREIRRVGENLARPVDVRVIAATNLELGEAVRAQRFREDLLFRLAVIRIAMPPLRERLEDLPGLAATFWRQAMHDVGKHARLTKGALAALSGHGWPGNVRELQNVLAALAVRAPARGRLGERDVRQILAGPPDGGAGVPLGDLRRQCERRAVASALARHGGRRTAAARELGLSRQGLSKAIRRLGLDEAASRGGVA